MSSEKSSESCFICSGNNLQKIKLVWWTGSLFSYLFGIYYCYSCKREFSRKLKQEISLPIKLFILSLNILLGVVLGLILIYFKTVNF